MSKVISEEKLKVFLEDIKKHRDKYKNSPERIQTIREGIKSNREALEAMTSIDMAYLMKTIGGD